MQYIYIMLNAYIFYKLQRSTNITNHAHKHNARATYILYYAYICIIYLLLSLTSK